MSGAHERADGVRRLVLESLDASPQEREELLRYGANHFGDPDPTVPLVLPLEPEPHVEAWRGYEGAARCDGALSELRRRLVQLRFPIRDGLADTDEYRAATRRGLPTEGMPSATGLDFESPESVRLLLHASPAGTVPVVVAGARADFVALVQALAYRNAPVPFPDSTGAYMVAGYVNLDRIATLRASWEADPEAKGSWSLEFKRLIGQKHLYQDRFILLAEGLYTGVDSGPLGVNDEDWIRISLRIRMEHECAHYFTRRVFGSMRSAALDEVIADYMGIVAGLGRFEPRLLLHVLGLEEDDGFRPGGRLANYLGDPPLSAGAFRALQKIVRRAAESLKAFDGTLSYHDRGLAARGRTLLALASLTLEEMAAPDGADRLLEARRQTAGLVCETEGA